MPSPLPSVSNPNPPTKNTLMSVLDVITVVILKRVRETIFFQSSKFIVCEVKDRKGVAKSLMVFNLRKVIRPFESRKYLRTL